MANYYESNSFNRFLTGLLVGLSAPFLFFFIYCLFRFQHMPFSEFFALLIKTGKIIHVMSLAVFPNLLPFMFFVKTDRYKSGRGVLAATVIFGLLIFVLKFYIG